IYQNDPATGGHDRAGRIRCAAYALDNSQNATVLWLGSSSGGLWKPINIGFGAVWAPISDNLPGSPSVGAFLVQPGNSNNILIGTGDRYRFGGSGMYKSTDGGGSWTLTSLSPAPSDFEKIVCDASDPSNSTVLAQGSNGIWRSTDFGDHWTHVYSGWATDLAQAPGYPKIWLAAIGGVGIYRSTDGGLTFPTSTIPADGDIANGLGTNLGRISLSMCASEPWFSYAIAEGAESGSTFGTLGGIFRSSDFGTDYYAIDSAVPDHLSGGQGDHACAIGVDPTNPDRVFCGMARMQWTDNATALSPTWNKTLPLSDGGHPDYTSFTFEPNSTTVIITNDGGYYAFDYSADTLSDGGNLLGLNCEQLVDYNGPLASSYDTPNLALAGLQDNGIVEGDEDVSGRWNFLGGGDGGFVSIQSDNSSVFTCTYGAPFDRYYSTNSGQSWNGVDLSLPGDGWTIDMILDPRLGLGAAPLYTWGHFYSNGSFVNGGVFYKPQDTGTDWKPVGPLLPNGYKVKQVDVAMDSSRTVIYAAAADSSGRIYAYNGALGSMSYSDITPPLPTGSTMNNCFINADKSRWAPDTLYYVTGSSYPARAYYSNNNGLNWTDVTGDLNSVAPGATLYKLLGNQQDSTELFLATNLGVYRSDNDGTNWYAFMDGLPAVPEVPDITITDDTANPALMHLATYGRGFWERQIVSDAVLTGITVSPSTVPGGVAGSATITLDRPAGPNGALVSLQSTNPNASPPATVFVPAGSSSLQFSFNTAAVASLTSGRLMATYHGVTVSATLNVAPVGLSTVAISPNPVVGSQTSLLTVTLNAPAGPNAIVVALRSSNTAVAGPASSTLTIPVGSASASVTVSTTAVTSTQTVQLSATLHGTTLSQPLSVRPIGVKLIALKSKQVTAGQSVAGGVQLQANAAPGPITVTMKSSNTAFAVVSPSTLTIPAGKSIGSFSVLTNKALKTTVSVVISAIANGTVKSVSLKIVPGIP
ncbi:MAG TPA: hypothetical protein VGS41_04185, partial [Chthonomonadales bacterium]|nr:hypothetical protein [Chthonomonadales bacterium]